MQGLLPGWTRKDVEQLPKFCSKGRNAKRVIYPRSAQVWISCKDFYLDEPKKDMKQLPIYFFFSTRRNAKRVLCPRSAQA